MVTSLLLRSADLCFPKRPSRTLESPRKKRGSRLAASMYRSIPISFLLTCPDIPMWYGVLVLAYASLTRVEVRSLDVIIALLTPFVVSQTFDAEAAGNRHHFNEWHAIRASFLFSSKYISAHAVIRRKPYCLTCSPETLRRDRPHQRSAGKGT